LQYAWADGYVLPSICEGSATVTHEALATGLPVVCTPNMGSVVQDDGIDGFMVPVRGSDSIAQKLDFLRNEDFLACMSENARARAAEFTLNEYSQRLIAAIVAAKVREG
jgi:glycosyltransferase involved in cell wall biosynthesis